MYFQYADVCEQVGLRNFVKQKRDAILRGEEHVLKMVVVLEEDDFNRVAELTITKDHVELDGTVYLCMRSLYEALSWYGAVAASHDSMTIVLRDTIRRQFEMSLPNSKKLRDRTKRIEELVQQIPLAVHGKVHFRLSTEFTTAITIAWYWDSIKCRFALNLRRNYEYPHNGDTVDV